MLCAPPTPVKRWYAPFEASTYTGLSARTLRDYVSRGDLRAYRIGPRQIRYDVADLDALLQPVAAVAVEVRDAS